MKTESVEKPYFARHAPGGLGYEIIKRKDFTRVYETPDPDQAKEVCQTLTKHADEDLTKMHLPTPSDKWPVRIIVFNEKHGDRHFIVKTNKDLESIALQIVLERKKEGWYYKPKEQTFAEPMTKEQIEALPTEGLREAAKREMKSLLSDKRYYKEEVENWATLEKIVKNKNGRLALNFLNSRRDGEYEKYEIVHPCNEEEVY